MNNIDYFILYGAIVILIGAFGWGVHLLFENIKSLKNLPSRYWEYKIEANNRIAKISCSLLGAILLIVLCVLFVFK